MTDALNPEDIEIESKTGPQETDIDTDVADPDEVDPGTGTEPDGSPVENPSG